MKATENLKLLWEQLLKLNIHSQLNQTLFSRLGESPRTTRISIYLSPSSRYTLITGIKMCIEEPPVSPDSSFEISFSLDKFSREKKKKETTLIAFSLSLLTERSSVALVSLSREETSSLTSTKVPSIRDKHQNHYYHH